MKTIRKFVCFAAAALLIMSCPISAFAFDVVSDARSRWVIGDEYGGAVGWNEDGSFTVYGKSGIATYTGAKFYDEEITIRFKASISSSDGWAAIYLRNNIDASLLTSKDDGGGVRAFPWYGKGQPFSINIKNDRVSLSQCYADELQPSGLGVNTTPGQYNPADGAEHTLTFRCYDVNDTQTAITVYYDGKQAFDYSYTYNEGHEPKKEAGYLSFACYDTGDWLQILSIEVPDGSVDVTENPASPSQNPQDTEKPEKDDSNSDDTKVDYNAQYNRPGTSSGTNKNHKTDNNLSWIWYVVCGVGGIVVGAAGAVVVMKLTAKKKSTKPEASDNTDLTKE